MIVLLRQPEQMEGNYPWPNNLTWSLVLCSVLHRKWAGERDWASGAGAGWDCGKSRRSERKARRKGRHPRAVGPMAPIRAVHPHLSDTPSESSVVRHWCSLCHLHERTWVFPNFPGEVMAWQLTPGSPQVQEEISWVPGGKDERDPEEVDVRA